MNRRGFLASSLAASAAGFAGIATAQDRHTTGQEFYDLRLYHLKDEAKLKLMDSFLSQAALPAAKRLGLGPIGVFYPVKAEESPTVYVLLTHKSLESAATTNLRLAEDDQFARDAAEYLKQPAKDPAFLRMENQWMVSFEGMPRLQVPAAARENKPRIFELRTYESPSEAAGWKKIEMFNRGEIAIFRRTGLNPVFFGETLVGSRLPNLTYMITFADMEEREKNWRAFSADPDWKSMSSNPEYADSAIVSKISNWFLRPAPYSQI